MTRRTRYTDFNRDAKVVLKRHFRDISQEGLEESAHLIAISSHPSVAEQLLPILTHKKKG